MRSSPNWWFSSWTTRLPGCVRWHDDPDPWRRVVAACLWDHAGGKGPLSLFWETAREVDPQVEDESHRAGVREGSLATLFAEAGLHGLEETTLSVSVAHPTFDDWWEPYALGVGPVGTYVAGLAPERRERLRDACRERLPAAPFTTSAHARGRASRQRLSTQGAITGEQARWVSSTAARRRFRVTHNEEQPHIWGCFRYFASSSGGRI